jgi:hypothetical protein
MSIKRKTLASMVLVAGTALCTPRLATALTFLVEGNTKYSADQGGQCTMLADVNLNDAYSSLVSALQGAGWGGFAFTEPNAWPQDLWEFGCTQIMGAGGMHTVLGGQDGVWADTRDLVVFFGHGGPNWEIWSRIHNNECTHNTTYHTRLGEWGGGQAAVAIWASCSMLNSVPAGILQDVEWQGLRQQFGFADSTYFYNDDLRNFFNATSTKTNANAWIDQFPAGRGRPVAFGNSRVSYADCVANQNASKMKAGIGMTPIGPGNVSCGGVPGPNYTCGSFRSN